jgi:uncharacterized membrane protein
MEAVMANPQSTAHIAGHPIHPILVTLPIGFFVAAFFADLGYWLSANAAWATGAMWLLGGGLIAAALAAVVGLIDFLGDSRIRALNDAWWHAGGNVVMVLIQLYNWYAHYSQGAAAVVPKGLLLSLLAVVILLFTGWKGGELVFRHRVGVTEDVSARRDDRPVDTPRRAA